MITIIINKGVVNFYYDGTSIGTVPYEFMKSNTFSKVVTFIRNEYETPETNN